MFRALATVPRTSSPVLTDWTIREFLEWIGEDDVRCHDSTLAGALAEIDATLSRRAGEEASALLPRSPAPLVRALSARLRAEPALRATRVRDLIG